MHIDDLRLVIPISKLFEKDLCTFTPQIKHIKVAERLPNVTNVPKYTLVPQFDFIQSS